jgi:DNA-binding transcriptional LysR family regulator
MFKNSEHLNMSKNPITIEALEVLDAIERRGSFASAAEELGKATSALSYIVQKLEEQLDVTLFTREGRRSVLTPAGRVVLEEGRLILISTAKLVDKSREISTGWEPRLRLSVGAPCDYPQFFRALRIFVDQHPSVEIDISEHILNGGWEALERDSVDLIVNVPGPVPKNRGYRSINLGRNDLALVVAKGHPILKLLSNKEKLDVALMNCRRVIAHDTTLSSISTSAGLVSDSDALYVQNMDQKVEAQLAGLGIGHLPRARIQAYLDNGDLVEVKTDRALKNESIFMVWKLANKGKALASMTRILEQELV